MAAARSFLDVMQRRLIQVLKLSPAGVMAQDASHPFPGKFKQIRASQLWPWAAPWLRSEPGLEGTNFPSARIYGATQFMKKSITVAPKKKRGRPPSGGRDPHVAARMPSNLIAEVEAWAEANVMSRSEAIRRLVELGLTVKAKVPQASESQKVRAREMAGEAIDKLTDTTAAPDDQAARKKRLLKGPDEFREVRVDRPGK